MCSVSGPLQTRCFMLSGRSAPLSALFQGWISISRSLKKHLRLPSARIHSIIFPLWSETSHPALIAFVLPAIYPSPSSSDSLLPPYGRFKTIAFFLKGWTCPRWGSWWLFVVLWWWCVLAASCALWRRRQGFTHEWRIRKSRQQRDVDTN